MSTQMSTLEKILVALDVITMFVWIICLAIVDSTPASATEPSSDASQTELALRLYGEGVGAIGTDIDPSETDQPLELHQIVALNVAQDLAQAGNSDEAASAVPLPTAPPEVPDTTDDPNAAGDPNTGEPFPAGNAVAIVPLDIPLDANIQRRIFEEVCYEEDEHARVEQFIMLMAIACYETGRTFSLTEISPAEAYGLFQIRPASHADRMARYGIYTAEGLFDPVASAYVALDYLDWIKNSLGVSTMTVSVYVVYNAGHYTDWEPCHAAGRVVMSYYDNYMAEFLAANPDLA